MNTPFVEAFAMANQEREKPRKKPYKKPQAVRELESMANAENAHKHPNTPLKYLAKSTYRDDTANGLTKCIIDFIRFNGGQAERIISMVPDVIDKLTGAVEKFTKKGDSDVPDLDVTIEEV